MTANDSIRNNLAMGFARQRPGGGCSGAMVVTPNEVWSYEERIAFRGDDEKVYVTRVKWSATTSAHTSTVRYALGRSGYVTDGTEDTEKWEVWRKAGTPRSR